MDKRTSVAAEIRAEQKAALKNMTSKEKVAYFWEYYKIHVLVGLGAIALVASILHTALTNKDMIFNAIMINALGLEGTLADDFSAYADFDQEQYLCSIDTSATLDIYSYSQFDIAILQRIIATTIAGDLDVIVSDADTFAYYADGSNFFTDLRTLLTESELALYQDDLYYIDAAAFSETQANDETVFVQETEIPTAEEQIASMESHRHPETMRDPIPVGIFLTDAAFIQATNSYPVLTPVFGIPLSSGRAENALLYLEYLWTTTGPEVNASGSL